jgi:translation initiation factor 2 subunit 3
MRFYINELPKVGDYVITLITEITEYGYTCELLEYNNITSHVKHCDISTQKIRNLKDLRKHSNVNAIEVMEVKDVDENHVSLNRKYLDSELKLKTMENYRLYSRIYNFINNNDTLDLSDDMKIETVKLIQNCENILEEILIEEIISNTPSLYDFLFSLITPKSIDKELLNKYDFKFLNFKNIYKFNKYCQKLLRECGTELILEYKNLKQNIFTLKSSKCNLKLSKFKDVERLINLYNEEQESEIEINTAKYSQNLDIDNLDKCTPILNLGIIGHVSHGKTTIIHRLTGIDTKKYKTEMQKGMTLKLGYTNTWITKCLCEISEENKAPTYIAKKCNNINNECQSYLISIIDCPGHSVLMNTMLSGASIMDTAMLIIAGNETCPQPQTEDHLLAITINDTKDKGFQQGIVIQNKLDLIPIESATEHKETIRDFLKDTLLENSPIIPISAQKDINIDLIIKWIFTFCNVKSSAQQSEILDSTFCKGIIVRTFDINKGGISMNENISGLILGGSILEGELSIGESIIILPQNIKTKIYEIKTGEIFLNKAKRGGLVAIKTDLNPYNADNYIGSFIIKEKDYNQEFIFEENSSIKLKLKIKEGCKKIFKNLKTVDVNVWGKDLKNCSIINLDKKIYNYKINYEIIFRSKINYSSNIFT